MGATLKDERGAVLIVELVVLAVVLAAAGFAAYQYVGHKNVSNKAAAPKPHIVAKSSPSPSPYAGWKSYTSTFEKLTFKYPTSWKPVAPLESNVTGADSFAIQSPDGLQVSWVAAADGLGGACNNTIMPGTAVPANEPGACPYWMVIDKQKLSGADLSYVAGVVTSDGTTYRPWCALQASDGIVQSESNIGYLMFQGKNNDYISSGGKHYPERAALLCGKPFGSQGTQTGTKAQAEALLSTPDYQIAKQILLSAAY